MNLIQTLTFQHQEMKRLANLMADIGVSRNEKVEIFAQLRQLLIDHRHLEDVELYPILIEKSQTNYPLQKKLEVFAADWEEISAFSKEYVEKYSNDISGTDFHKDTGKLFANLRARIMKEEMSLFPEYKKISEE